MELTDRDAIHLAFDYYIGLGFSIADSSSLIDRLLKAKVEGMIKFAYEQGVEDEILAVRHAQSDRDFYDWKGEVNRRWNW